MIYFKLPYTSVSIHIVWTKWRRLPIIFMFFSLWLSGASQRNLYALNLNSLTTAPTDTSPIALDQTPDWFSTATNLNIRSLAWGDIDGDGDLDPVVLHRRVEVLLHGGLEAVDLVDEQHVARAELREVRGQRALVLDRGRAHRAERHAEGVRDHVRERGLAEAGRAAEEDVIERFTAIARRLDEDTQILPRGFLPHELVECLGTQRGVYVFWFA